MENSSKKAEMELEFIKKIIRDSRRKISARSLGSVIWGLIVLVGILYTYFSIYYFRGKYITLTWLSLTLAGWIFSFLEKKYTKKKEIAKTLTVKIQTALWKACGISMSIIGITIMLNATSGQVNPMMITPIISVILGIGYYVTGIINENKFMSTLGFGWWSGSIVLFYWESYNTFLLFAIMLILFQIIPGIYYYRKSKYGEE